MSDNFENIERLFQDRFEGYEEAVDPNIWEAVQSKLPQTGSAPPDAGMAQTGGKVIFSQFSTATIVTVTSIAASLLVAFGVYQYLSKHDTPVQPKEELVEQEVSPINNKENNKETVVEQVESVNNIEDPVFNDEPELVQKGPDDPGTNDLPEKGSDPVVTPPSNNNDLVNDNSEVEDTGIKDDIPEKNDAEEQLANNGSDQVPLNNNEDIEEEQVTPPPVIEEIFAGIQFEKIQGKPYSFKFKNSGKGSRHEWDMGDGSYAIVDDPEHTFDSPGKYTVRLTVHSQDGRSTQDELEITVFEPSELILPATALSPNGDRVNDVYDVEGLNMQQVSIKVMNFSGELVFTSDSFDKDWDGTDNNGRPLPPGQYPVVIEALGFDSVLHTKKTFVSLYR